MNWSAFSMRRQTHIILYLCLFCLVCNSSACSTTGTRETLEIKSKSAVLEHKVPQSSSNTALTLPVRLVIPAIHVDATVEPVGILANGDLDTPHISPLANVGWYSAGPRPGERGSAVIDGHVNGPGGTPAVFERLLDLQVGDTIRVTTGSGSLLEFHVVKMATYPPTQAPLQAIFGDAGGVKLNLITCAGTWIPSQQQTTLRRVVYASL